MNDNPQAVRIANERIRPLADKMAGLYADIADILLDAKASDWASVFPPDKELIADGADRDGRTPIGNMDILILLKSITGLYENLTANPEAIMVTRKIAVNPR